jgi:hypothetical protein
MTKVPVTARIDAVFGAALPKARWLRQGAEQAC